MLEQVPIIERVGPPVSLKLVEEINHRVMNQYAEAIASLSLATLQSVDDATRAVLVRAADRLRDHADSHRALMPPVADGDANLADHVAGICRAFTKATLAERNIRLVLTASEMVLPVERCWRIGLVIVELVRNAARHGLAEIGGLIGVTIMASEGQLLCEVRDNGRPRVRIVPGRGQGLIRSLVTELGGEVAWTFAADGTTALVQLPLFDAPTGCATGVSAGTMA